jgi:hypothetical protein
MRAGSIDARETNSAILEVDRDKNARIIPDLDLGEPLKILFFV